MKYRHLSSDEITTLKAQGNIADSWDNILVADSFDASRLTNNHFSGEINIGCMTDNSLSHSTLTLPVGISGCWVANCTIGDNCAIHNVHYINGYTRKVNDAIGEMTEMGYIISAITLKEYLKNEGIPVRI